jgi:FkbM family methyltransferase
MVLRRLLNVRRYRRCRSLFRSPLSAHVRIALGLRSPLNLELREGATLRFANGFRCRRTFDWILDKAPDPFPVTFDGELVEFSHVGRRVVIPASSGHTFRTVVVRDGYGLRRLPGPLGTVVDLGANVGLFAMQAVALAERVICVEAMEANFEIAKRNIARAAVSGNYTVRRAAVSGRSGGTVRVYSSDENPGGHSIYRNQAARWGNRGTYEEVPAITLAGLFAEEKIERCSLLKCDVEGAEFETFEAAPLELLSRIERIFMEVHLAAVGYDDARFEALCRKLKVAGLDVRHKPLRSPWGSRRSNAILVAVSRLPRAGRLAPAA